MFYIAMAVIGELTFMMVALLGKRLRNKSVQTMSILATYGLTIPVWIAIAAALIVLGQAAFTPVYGLIVAAWLATCFFLNFGATYLMKYQSMSDGTGYRFGFSVMLALLADVFIFSTGFSYEKIFAIAALFTGGTILHFSRQKQVDASMTMPLPRRLTIIFTVALAEIATYALFKYGASLQPSPTFHNALSQLFLFIIFMGMGHRALRRDYAEGKISNMVIGALAVLLVIACLAEGLAIAALPISIFIMFTLIRAVVWAIHDIKTGELRLTCLNGLAIGMIIGGLVYTGFLNYHV